MAYTMFGGIRRRRRGGCGMTMQYPYPRYGYASAIKPLMSGVGRRRRGRGEGDAPPKSTLGKVNSILKNSGIIGKTLDEFGLPFSAQAKLLGYGRRRRTGRSSVYGGRKRKRRVGMRRRGRGIPLLSLLGFGRRRRTKKVGMRRKRKGRGIEQVIGGLGRGLGSGIGGGLSSLLGGLFGGRRRRRRLRPVNFGGRRRRRVGGLRRMIASF